MYTKTTMFLRFVISPEEFIGKGLENVYLGEDNVLYVKVVENSEAASALAKLPTYEGQSASVLKFRIPEPEYSKIVLPFKMGLYSKMDMDYINRFFSNSSVKRIVENDPSRIEALEEKFAFEPIDISEMETFLMSKGIEGDDKKRYLTMFRNDMERYSRQLSPKLKKGAETFSRVTQDEFLSI